MNPEEVKWQSVKSSFISALGYDEDSKTLWVAINGKTGEFVIVYEYPQIEKSIYDSLLTSRARGKYFIANVRSLYNKCHGEWHFD